MASYTEDKWSHSTTIDLLLWQSVHSVDDRYFHITRRVGRGQIVSL